MSRRQSVSTLLGNVSPQARYSRLDQEQKAGLDPLISQAGEFGASAFHAGKMSVPAHDGRVMGLVAQIGSNSGHAILILDAWNRAWHRENLKAPV